MNPDIQLLWRNRSCGPSGPCSQAVTVQFSGFLPSLPGPVTSLTWAKRPWTVFIFLMEDNCFVVPTSHSNRSKQVAEGDDCQPLTPALLGH